MSATRPLTRQAWPSDIARTCANGDGRPTVMMLHGVPYCGKCALELLRLEPAADGELT